MAPRVARVSLVLIGCAWAAMAGTYWHLRSIETLWPNLWPIVYALAAAACILGALTRRPIVVDLAGALTFVGLLSRVAGLWYNAVNDVYLDAWQIVPGLAMYPVGAFALLFVWRHGFDPWARHRLPSLTDAAAARRLRGGRRVR